MRLTEAEPGSTVELRRISGGGKTERLFGDRGLATGAELTVISLSMEDGAMIVESGGRLHRLTAAESAALHVGEPLSRSKDDPIFLGGCCAYGNSADIWDRIERMGEPQDDSGAADAE